MLETLGYKGLLNAKQWFSIFHYTFEYVEQGDSKVSAKGGDNSVKQDTAGSHGGAQPGSVSQGMGHQGSFTQGMSYFQPQ